jgi:hypothetical protein
MPLSLLWVPLCPICFDRSSSILIKCLHKYRRIFVVVGRLHSPKITFMHPTDDIVAQWGTTTLCTLSLVRRVGIEWNFSAVLVQLTVLALVTPLSSYIERRNLVFISLYFILWILFISSSIAKGNAIPVTNLAFDICSKLDRINPLLRTKTAAWRLRLASLQH